MTRMEPENSAPGIITDHKYDAPLDEPWGRCVHCGLAQAAHLEIEPGAEYTTPKGMNYRCPDCVTKGKKTCLHRKRSNG